MRHKWWAAVFAVVAIGTLTTLAWNVSYQFHAYKNEQVLDEDLSLVIPALESEITRYRTLSDVLREDSRIKAALVSANETDISTLKTYLSLMQKRTGALQLFVLNSKGKAIASSEWPETTTPLPEIDLSYRPYFQDAMKYGHSIFYGFSFMTNQPDLYVASQVNLPPGKQGVIVAQLDLNFVETSWWGIDAAIALTDENGIVFLSNHEDWKYRPLEALSPRTLDAIADSRQFGNIDFATRRSLFDAAPDGEIASMAGSKYLFRMQPVGDFGWHVIVARPFSGANAAANVAALIVLVIGLIISGIVFIYYQRGQLVRITNEQSVLLEQRVEERTRELAAEVEIRRRTEQNLRAAEDDLVQATKLATLGQLSAALAHEVSQPVTALAALLTAAERRLDAGENDIAHQLIERAQSLTLRLQHVIRHLRSFAKKERGKSERVSLEVSISAALELAETRAREIGVTIVTLGLDRRVEVLGNSVRLEQVLINLLLNALDAVAGLDQREVGIALDTDATSAIIRVWDTGQGIPDGFGERISEPFFTTKAGQDGLGLGLTISQSILADYGAKMSFLPRDGGGTICEVRLPLAAEGEQIEAAE